MYYLFGVRDDPEYQVSRITIKSKDFEEMDIASRFF